MSVVTDDMQINGEISRKCRWAADKHPLIIRIVSDDFSGGYSLRHMLMAEPFF